MRFEITSQQDAIACIHLDPLFLDAVLDIQLRWKGFLDEVCSNQPVGRSHNLRNAQIKDYR